MLALQLAIIDIRTAARFPAMGLPTNSRFCTFTDRVELSSRQPDVGKAAPSSS